MSNTETRPGPSKSGPVLSTVALRRILMFSYQGFNVVKLAETLSNISVLMSISSDPVTNNLLLYAEMVNSLEFHLCGTLKTFLCFPILSVKISCCINCLH